MHKEETDFCLVYYKQRTRAQSMVTLRLIQFHPIKLYLNVRGLKVVHFGSNAAGATPARPAAPLRFPRAAPAAAG